MNGYAPGEYPGDSQVETGTLCVIPLRGIGEVHRGDDLASLIASRVALEDFDVVVVTQKIVSKSEGRMVEVDPADPAARSALAESEAVRVLRRRGDLVVTETRHGFVCANSGVDMSNVETGLAALLPEDPDRSARRIRDGLRALCSRETAVIVSDTFGRPWRRGLVDVAIGCAGIAAVVDLRGSNDWLGAQLNATEVCIADEIASAAELMMGKADGVPVAVVRGANPAWFGQGSVAREVVRPSSEDLFR